MTSILKNVRIEVPLKQRIATVIEVKDLSKTLRRVTFQGDDLAGFGFHPLAPEAHVKLFFPEKSREELCLPTVLSNGQADWKGAGVGRFSPFREYTIRSYDADSLKVEIDFVLHDEGVGGPWATQAKVGQSLGIFGPRSVKLPPLDASNYVFFADETSLPAVARWLEILPDTAKIDAWIEVQSAENEVSLPMHNGANIHWLHRNDGLERVPYGALHLEILADLSDYLLSENTWVWGATEAHTIAQMKRELIKNSCINTDHLDLTSYWKHD